MSAPETEFRRILDAAGLAPAEIIMDGQLHRCATAEKPRSKNGWYIFHPDPPASGAFGDWSKGTSETWTAKTAEQLTPAEREAQKRRIEADRAAGEKATAELHSEKAALAKSIIESAPVCPADHPYLVKKGVPPLGSLRLANDGRAIVPVLNEQGQTQSLQFIAGDGQKRFLTGGKMAGGFCPIGSTKDKIGLLYIAEGYATAATIHMASGCTVLTAFNAGNLKLVAETARRLYPVREIVVCADDDHTTEGNPGLTKATEAAKAINGKLAVPVFLDPAGRTDFNDMHAEQGLDAVRDALEPKCLEDDDGTIRIQAGELAALVDACEAVLALPDLPVDNRVFQRGGQLWRVGTLPASASFDGVTRPAGAVVILPVTAPFLLTVLSRHGRFEKFDRRSNQWRPADPPKPLADAILSRAGMWPFPNLRGVVGCPTVRADGSMLTAPGYDAATGYFIAHNLTVDVLDSPTRDDVVCALTTIEKLLAGFSFVGGVDRSVALALILTAMVRPAMDSVPLFAITAPVRGSGKSTLMDIAAILATGRRSAVLSATGDSGELEKRLVGCMLSGDAIINLDNLNGELSSDLLCQATTAESVKVRPLGASAQVEIPNTTLWSANGNNLTLAGDLSRRALLCRLDPGVERPEERVFDFDPLAEAMKNRSTYVAAVLTLVRGYVVAGRPDLGLSPFGSFDRWAGLVRNALVWAGEPDPCASRAVVLSDDPEAAQVRTLLTAWHGRFGRTPRTVKEVIRAASEDDSPLAEILDDIAGEQRGGINSRRLGKWLKRQAGRIAGGLKLTRYGTTDVANWKVVPENAG